MQEGAHMNASNCAGCTSPAGPFAATVNGMAMPLCAACAARLTTGESKSDVIKTISLKEVA
jgi:hypothetical protein